MLNIYEINDYMLSIFMYKQIKSGMNDFYIMNSSIHNHETRRSDDLHVPSSNSCVREFSVRINGALKWNSLPSYIRASQSLNVFKQSLKRYIIDKRTGILVS